LALQNHAPVLRPGYEDALAMLRELDRPNVGLCLDAPLFKERQSDDYMREAVHACRGHVRLTHYGAWNFVEQATGDVVQGPCPSFGGTINYRRYLAELQQAGYDGYLVSEYCLPCIADHRVAGIDAVDRGTAMALRYMKNLVMTPQAA
jgi:sugar phosphate isomerase/epimerase